MLNFLIYLHAEIINFPNKNNTLHLCIAENNKYFPYFQDCLGALDDIYISAHIPSINGAAY